MATRLRLQVIQSGRLRDTQVQVLAEDYRKRLRRYGELDIVERRAKPPSGLWRDDGALRILLDQHGETFDSAAFAQWLERWTQEHGRIAFAVGDADGHDDLTRGLADHRLSLSAMTFPHRLAHLMLVEQLYRAASILAGHPYHHA